MRLVENTVDKIGNGGNWLGTALHSTSKKIVTFFVGLFILIIYGIYAFISELMKGAYNGKSKV